jgi:mono/diheme cytochrome c family protein
MAATDKHYRSQYTLDIVFALSCILMLVGVVWMFVADFNREWKPVQRTFRDVETARNERLMLDMLPPADEVHEKSKVLKDRREALDKAKAALRTEESKREAALAKVTVAYQTVKADFDAVASRRDAAYERLGNAIGDERKPIDIYIQELEKQLDDLRTRKDAAQKKLEAAEREYREKVRENPLENIPCKLTVDNKEVVVEKPTLKDYEDSVSQAEDNLKKTTARFDLFGKTAAQKSWKFGDTLRALPILDAFASPTRINQIALPELTIDYSFKDVPRYDRCTTCHLGIDRGAYDRASLQRLTSVPDDLREKVNTAYGLFQQRAANGENLGFNPSDLPTTQPLGWLGWVVLIVGVALAGVYYFFRRNVGLTILILVAGLIGMAIVGVVLPMFVKPQPTVSKVDLTGAQITQYCAHPHLDLYVDTNSAHPAEKFGCTICHSGQGSATEFVLASHTPNDTWQQHEWTKNAGWFSNHDWEYPMLPNRFVESSCLKCHHQVTDLVRQGSKEEAPKVLKGFNLIRENGCFGCHEINGTKNGRAVGPDLRVEPTPALDFLTAAEQERLKADPANPPGTYRKVGPALRRIAEKTDEKWTRKWIQSPRGFRPDTKMPHFYGLNNNDPENLPESQKNFPAAEIHAITYYLFRESEGFLNFHYDTDKKTFEGGDSYRRGLLNTIDELQKRLKEGPLNDKDRKDLSDATKQLADLALLSNSTKASTINSYATDVKTAQDRLIEIQRRNNDEDDQTKKSLLDTLAARTLELKKLSEPGKLNPARLVDSEGNPVQLPDLTKDSRKAEVRQYNGRTLLIQRGCFACHAHEGTEKEATGTIIAENPQTKKPEERSDKSPAIASESNFGPNLSRIAAKIKGDKGRLWLVQWLLNPSVHHPRTRMPVVHLTVDQASDIAEWLMAQKKLDVQAWETLDDVKQPNGSEPGLDTFVELARVYLRKAPGITNTEADTFLASAEKPTELGIPVDRLKSMARDADERRLELGKVDLDALRWYVGRKSISRQGCFGCHDIPGFESAKPIGTALEDWGKKDPHRLAFEDATAFAKEHFNIVPFRLTATQRKDRIAELEKKKEAGTLLPEEKKELGALNNDKLNSWDIIGGEGGKHGKRPYEQYFFDLLKHESREGFLSLKLAEPRSYDFNRRRDWDERLRMPQFQFARSRQKTDESDHDYEVRHTQEEAEARETVMTFVLGLVADPINLKYIYNPPTDRKHEVMGRQVLEKYNCGGCHQIRSGVFDIKQSKTSLDYLEKQWQRYNTTKVDGIPQRLSDYPFPNHNAWFGTASTSPDRLTAHGVQYKGEGVREAPSGIDMEPEDAAKLLRQFRLTQALRFTNQDGQIRDLPAGEDVVLHQDDLLHHTDPYGGVFPHLMVGYLQKYNPDVYGRDENKLPDVLNVMPPPLLREGERVQPRWLYQFLQHPFMIRPETLLRMPRFNMSPEEAQALVDYFAAVDRQNNPGANITYPYVEIPQREENFWTRQTSEYIARLKADKQEKPRLEALKPMWDIVSDENERAADRRVKDAEEALKQAKTDDDKKKAQQELDEAKQAQTAAKDKAKSLQALDERWLTRDAYSSDAYRLLLNHARGACIGCHKINGNGGLNAPSLDLAASRLRPDWTLRWIGNPVRMFPYKPAMPVNFPNQYKKSRQQQLSQELFDGEAEQQIMAVRDVLMNLQQLAEQPSNRYFRPGSAGGAK